MLVLTEAAARAVKPVAATLGNARFSLGVQDHRRAYQQRRGQPGYR
jgi:hypothetical protein